LHAVALALFAPFWFGGVILYLYCIEISKHFHGKQNEGGMHLVEEETARELKKLFAELVDHSYGHHGAIDGL
jgi:hypothetical protein